MRTQRVGKIVAFDANRGLGEVVEADGTRRAFHCTQIADGTRTIPVGVEVRYVLVPASRGAWEASEIARIG